MTVPTLPVAPGDVAARWPPAPLVCPWAPAPAPSAAERVQGQREGGEEPPVGPPWVGGTVTPGARVFPPLPQIPFMVGVVRETFFLCRGDMERPDCEGRGGA